jgi:cytochrome P450
MMRKVLSWLKGSAPKPEPDLPVDLTSPAFFQNPEAIYARLRTDLPIAPVKQGGYLLTRHADIVAAFSNASLGNAPSRFSVLAERNRGKYVAAALTSNIPPFLDAPRHVPIRKSVSRAFYTAMESVPDWLPSLARDHVRRAQAECDLLSAIAEPFALSAMARFIGLDHDAPRLKTISNQFFHLFAPIQDAQVFAALNEDLQDGRQWIRDSIAQGNVASDTVIGALQGLGLTEEEIADNAILLLADGTENIVAGIAMVFDRLHTEGIRLADQPSPLPPVTEAIRLNTPGQIIPRVAREDCTVLGQELTAGTPVYLALGSGNLDAAAHVDPLQFRPDRSVERLIMFGLGRHSCIGMQLGQLLIATGVQALQDADAQPLDAQITDWRHRFGHRWPASYRVGFGA